MTDLRFGFRILVNSPAFAAVAVLVLSLGIGANTAIFSFVDAILFRPLPVDRPEEIVAVGRGGGATNLYSEYISWRDHNLVFSDLAAVMPLPVAAGGRRVLGEVVSANYFPVLGVKLAIGRPFLSGERRVTVVSYSFWKTHPVCVDTRIFLAVIPPFVRCHDPIRGIESSPEMFGLEIVC